MNSMNISLIIFFNQASMKLTFGIDESHSGLIRQNIPFMYEKKLPKLLFTTLLELTISKNCVWLETVIDWFIKMTLNKRIKTIFLMVDIVYLFFYFDKYQWSLNLKNIDTRVWIYSFWTYFSMSLKYFNRSLKFIDKAEKCILIKSRIIRTRFCFSTN